MQRGVRPCRRGAGQLCHCRRSEGPGARRARRAAAPAISSRRPSTFAAAFSARRRDEFYRGIDLGSTGKTAIAWAVLAPTANRHRAQRWLWRDRCGGNRGVTGLGPMPWSAARAAASFCNPWAFKRRRASTSPPVSRRLPCRQN